MSTGGKSIYTRKSFGRKQTIYIPNNMAEEGGKYFTNLEYIRNRVIYTIQNKLTEEELFYIIKSNNIDYFSIDTTCFLNVKEYREMINIIKRICFAEQKLIGIIVELRGRKVQVINLKNTIEYRAGDIVYITHNAKKKSDGGYLAINSKDLHRMVNRGDHIIVNDNQGVLVVKDIVEDEAHSRKSVKYNISEDNLCGLEGLGSKLALRKDSSNVDTHSYISESDKNANDILNCSDSSNELILQDCELYFSCNRDEYIKKMSHEFEIKQNEESLSKRRLKLRSSKSNSNHFDIRCEVTHDFKVTENSFLYVPSK
jgi:hypothetical protein